ncbi:hypothetical protein C8J57DRAFT_1733738 [Mycena rebaudengoi]|nr:hypothetical protein C8J57DRAFT_1737489 [Mycena rebaudengoi]KAJ7209888.1 hypothetical protein C8J57DRAFT_1733738 [Mycena rebaudengoi]
MCSLWLCSSPHSLVVASPLSLLETLGAILLLIYHLAALAIIVLQAFILFRDTPGHGPSIFFSNDSSVVVASRFTISAEYVNLLMLWLNIDPLGNA